MPEAAGLLALPLLLVLAGGAVGLRAVLDGRLARVPASVAVLAPLAAFARAVRTRPVVAPGALGSAAAGAGLLLAAALRVLVVPVTGAPMLDGPLGIGWLLVADAIAGACWWSLARPTRPRRTLASLLVLEAPVVVALATAAIAAHGPSVSRVLAAQRDLPLAVEAPVVLLVLLLGPGLLLPWSGVAGDRGGPAAPAGPTGIPRLLVGAGRAAQVASTAVVAAGLLLPAGPSGGRPEPAWIVLEAAVGTVLLVVLARRLPAPRPEQAATVAAAVLLPLAVLQLGVVAVLTLLTG